MTPQTPEKDSAWWLAAIKKDRNYALMTVMPPELLSKDFCIAVVENNGDALQYVPLNYVDYRMCLTAIQHSGRALKYAPMKYRDPTLCEMAVRSFPRALQYVPELLRTSYLCNTAVAHDIRACPRSCKNSGNVHGRCATGWQVAEICTAGAAQPGNLRNSCR